MKPATLCPTPPFKRVADFSRCASPGLGGNWLVGHPQGGLTPGPERGELGADFWSLGVTMLEAPEENRSQETLWAPLLGPSSKYIRYEGLFDT